MQSADVATVTAAAAAAAATTAIAAAAAIAATASFYSSQPEQSSQHRSQAKLEAQRSDAEMQKKNICVRQSSVQIWNVRQSKAKANKPQHRTFNPHAHASHSPHNGTVRAKICVSHAAANKQSQLCLLLYEYVVRPSSHCCHLFNIFCIACNRAATTKSNICGDAFKK